MDRGAWWAAVHGVAQSWTRLKRLSRDVSIHHKMNKIKKNLKMAGYGKDVEQRKFLRMDLKNCTANLENCLPVSYS